jgi:hypothetical protein
MKTKDRLPGGRMFTANDIKAAMVDGEANDTNPAYRRLAFFKPKKFSDRYKKPILKAA